MVHVIFKHISSGNATTSRMNNLAAAKHDRRLLMRTSRISSSRMSIAFLWRAALLRWRLNASLHHRARMNVIQRTKVLHQFKVSGFSGINNSRIVDIVIDEGGWHFDLNCFKLLLYYCYTYLSDWCMCIYIDDQ